LLDITTVIMNNTINAYEDEKQEMMLLGDFNGRRNLNAAKVGLYYDNVMNSEGMSSGWDMIGDVLAHSIRNGDGVRHLMKQEVLDAINTPETQAKIEKIRMSRTTMGPMGTGNPSKNAITEEEYQDMMKELTGPHAN